MAGPIRIAILANATQAKKELRDTTKASRDFAHSAEQTSERLSHARQREELAARSVEIQEARLAALREDGNASAAQVATAEEKLIRIRNAHVTAQANLTKAQEDHNRVLARSNDQTGKLRLNLQGLSRQLAELKTRLRGVESLGTAINNYARGASKATLVTTGLTAALAAAGGAAGPLLALGGGVAASLGAGGLGVGAFTALVVPSFRSVASATEGVTKAQEAYDAAVAAGDKDAATKALQARTAALKDLTPAQRQAVLSTLDLKDAFSEASKQFADPAIRTYTRGVQALKDLIPTLVKVAAPVQTALVAQFDRLFASLRSPELTAFTDRLARYVGPIIKTTGDLVADLGMTFGHLIDAALPVSNQLLSIFGSLFSELREASASSGLADFFRESVPLASKLADFISALVNAFGDLITAAMPLSGPLLSTLEKLSDSLSKLFQSEQFGTFTRNLGQALTALSPVLDVLLQAIGSVASIMAGALAETIVSLTPFVRQFAATFVQVLQGVAPLLPVLGQLISAIGAALLPALGKLIPAIAAALIPVVQELAKVLPSLAPSFMRIVEAITPLLPLIADVLVQVVPLIPKVVELVAAIVEWYVSTGNIQAALKILGEIVAAVGKIIGGVCDVIIGILSGDWSKAWNGAVAIVQGVWALIQAAVKLAIEQVVGLLATFLPNVRKHFSDAWEAAKKITTDAWSNIGKAISGGVSQAVAWVKSLPARIIGVFAGAGGWLWDAGRRIIQGLIDGITRMISRVRSALTGLTSMIPAWKGPRERDASLLFAAGELIMQSLVRGFAAGEADVAAKLADLTQRIQTSLSPTLSPRIDPRMGDLSLLGGRGGQLVVQEISVEISASPGTNMAELGREVTRALAAYKAAGGKLVTA